MFDLNASLAEWRRQMAAGGIKSGKVLDELQSHVRDAVERQTQSGRDAREAFESAIQQIGQATDLGREFRKLKVSAVEEALMIALCLVFLSLIILLSALAIWICYWTWWDRVMASVAVSAILIVACGWRYAVPFLPFIESTPKRWIVGLTCVGFGFVASSLYCGLILPHFEHGPDHMLPAIGVWAVFLIEVFACGGVGLMLSRQQRHVWEKGEARKNLVANL